MDFLKHLPPPAVIGAYLSVLLMLGELLVRGKGLRNYLLAALFGSLSLMLLHGHWVESGAIKELPHAYQVHVPFVFATGPLLYLYFQLQMREETTLPPRYWLHFAPALLSLLIMLPLYLESTPEKTMRISALWKPGNVSLTVDYGIFPFIIGLTHLAVYSILTPVRFFPGLRLRSSLNEPAMRIMFSFCGLGLILTIMVIVGVFFRSRQLIRGSLDGLSLVIPFIYIMMRRYPRFFHDLVSYSKREKYRQTQLKGVDLGDIDSRLDQLMRGENLHRDDELTLAGLATRLHVTTHQLSEYFNNHRKVNFAGYINGLRIEEAQDLLGREDERTVLSIAYEVGFNSKSAFNRAFTRHVGMSPTEYRKKNP